MSEKEIKQRAGYRSVITKQLDDIQTFLSDSSLAQLNAKLAHIKSVGKKLIDLNADILTNTHDKDIEREITTACEYDEKCHLIISELEACIASQSGPSVKPKKTIKDLNLPKLILPRFSGKLIEWISFWDIFRSTVHEAEIDNVRKFYYLRGQLDGPAKSLIEGFSIDDDSYQQAVELLKITYGNTEQLKIAHVIALMEVEAPRFNADELSKFRSDIECHTRSLKTLGTTLDEVMVIIMRQKLPLAILDKVRSFDLEQFKTSLGTEISNLQLSSVTHTDIKPVSEQSKGTMSMVISKKATKKGMRCKLCDKEHRWFKCNKYPTPLQKVNRAKHLKLCTGCLGNDHQGKCTAGFLRPCRRCTGRHFEHLCVETVEEPETAATTLALKCQGTVSLPTVRIPMNGKRERVICRALLDQCSQRTFVKRDLLNNLRHRIVGHDSLKLVGFLGETDKREYPVAEVTYKYRGKDHALHCVVVENLPEHKIQGIQGVERALKKRNIFLSDPMGDANIDILIGADHYYDVVHTGFKRVNDITLIPTKFGYCLSGRIKGIATATQVDTVSILRVGSTVLDNINDPNSHISENPVKVDLEKFWELDHIGIKSDEVDKDSKAALEIFESTINWCKDEKQYEVGLPWRDEYIELPTNYGMARSRLIAVRNKLHKTPSHLRTYDNIFQEYIQRGFIEPVNDTNRSSDSHNLPRVHYLPHHGVHKDSATTPIRVVFDCSAHRGEGRSLNDCLLTGPSLVADLSQQLLRFRLGQFAAISDIEKAFLMVKLRPSDRDVTRFLWYRDPFDPNSEIVTYRFTVVLFGATCSQFLLNATIKHHLENCTEDTGKLLRGLYIDNLQGSSNTQQELLDFYKQACRLFDEAHLNLREWDTNAPVLAEQFLRDGKGADKTVHTRVLGMRWNTGNDKLSYIPRNFIQEEAYTKRTFLSKAAQFFDPLGLALPLTIRARILMQEIWRRNLQWDDSLPSDLQKLGRDLLNEFTIVSRDLQVTRYNASYDKETILHGFCDASNLAYGAAVYLSNALGVGLITARAKVAPMKGLTIPKMELTSMLILGRLIKHVTEAYKGDVEICAIHIWSDSQIALNWAKGNKTLPVYVRNRVDEIKALVPNAHFHYVKSTDNPSDLLTRGLTASQLLRSSLWWFGPTWLRDQNEWTDWQPRDADDNLITSDAIECRVGVNVRGTQSDALKPEPKFPWDRFSKYTKLIRVVGWIRRFANNALTQNKTRGPLNTKEYIAAELTVLQMVQKESYASEYETLSRSDKSKSCVVRQLNLFMADGLIKCRGRLNWSLLDEDVKYPILIPSKHLVTNLIIQHAHIAVKHYGVDHTVSHIRLRWWIPRIRQIVKKVIRICVKCQRLKKRPCSTGPAPDLPPGRVQPSEPFSVIGIDYTGALRIRGETKVYILLFTCAVTRAVHLELCDTMTSEDFMLAFRRFCARRSYPKLIYSDNAPTFHQAASYLNTLKEDPVIKDNLSINGCDWKFIPVEAPWMGGMWERCVGTIKGGLRAVIGRALLTRAELNTILIEIEAVVNDRPITYVYNDINEPLPLTPAHLLYGRPITSFPTDTQSIQELADPTSIDKQNLTRRYIYISKLIEDFRRRWSKDYLLSLRERREKHNPPNSKLKVGDVVLIQGEGPRIYWRMGRVLDLYSGEDQTERVALLKTSTGNTVRPIARLCHLEITDSTLVNELDYAGPEDERDVTHPVVAACPQNVDITTSPQVGIARPDSRNMGLPSQVRTDTMENQNGNSPLRLRTRRAAADAQALWRSKQASGQL